jgi:hypothetical protein
MASASVSNNETRDYSCQSQQGINHHKVHKERFIERALVEVHSVSFLQILFPSVEHQGGWDDEKNKRSADAACVGNEDLRLLEKEDYDDDWDRYDNTPDALHDFAVIL